MFEDVYDPEGGLIISDFTTKSWTFQIQNGVRAPHSWAMIAWFFWKYTCKQKGVQPINLKIIGQAFALVPMASEIMEPIAKKKGIFLDKLMTFENRRLRFSLKEQSLLRKS